MVEEGRTRLAVPASPDSQRGPASRDPGRAFYNPAMRTNRDLSVLLVEAFAHMRGRPVDVADVLAGAGARSLRLAHEVDADITVHANDGDPHAVRAIQAGQEDNGIDRGRLQVQEGNAHAFLSTRRYDVVDVDPYGSPAPFVDAAVRATRHDGLVCLTATDTGALCGRYPRVVRRRYGAWHGLHARPWRAEVGLRILLASTVHAAARHARGVVPVLSVSQGHWMRVVCRVEDGRGRADAACRSLGYVVPDGHGRGTFTDRPAGDAMWAGPVWTGSLHEEGLLDRLASGLADHAVAEQTAGLVRTLQAEARGAAFWVQAGDLGRRLGGDAPRQDRFRTALQEQGHAWAPTHMDPQGTRTDAPWEAVERAWFEGKAV